MENRPNIGEDIKREVRQRCGFGCVVCGMPIYEYEHKLEWAIVKRHVAEEITLLCPLHHTEKTKGLLPKVDVEIADKDPFNKRKGVTSRHLLHYKGNKIKLSLGESDFIYSKIDDGCFVAPLFIDNEPVFIFRVEQGQLLMSFIARNEENIPVFKILDNAVVINTLNWDVEWIGTTLTIREGKGRIFLKIDFLAPSEIAVRRARILHNGIELIIGSNYIFGVNKGDFIGRIQAIDCSVGLCLGFPIPEKATIGIPDIPRYNIDRIAAMKRLRFLLKKRKSI